MSIEHVEAAAMHRDIDRAEQWDAEPYSARRHPPNPRRNRRRPVAPRMGRRRPTWADMVRGVAVDSTGWGYLPGHAPIYVGWTVPDAHRGDSLFAGYGGIELALSSVLDVRPAWFVEFDKAPSKVLAHHWPDVPNYGDVTTVDWSTVPPVDIITGGSPCGT